VFGAEPYTTDGEHHAGAIYVEDRPGDETYYPHATFWPTVTGSGVALGVSGTEISSVAYGMEWPHQYGGNAGADDAPQFVHSMMWGGSPETGRSMHPLTAYPAGTSYILGAGDGQQVGFAGTSYTVRRPALWSNSAASFVELSANGVESVACSGGYQVIGSRLAAGPDSETFDLSSIVPPGVPGFGATCIDVDQSGTIRVGGTALVGGVIHACLAVHDGTTGCAADWDADGVLNSGDFFAFLISFFSGNADFNADDATTSQDFFDFLNAFFAGC
jgi:hypothetical protein